MGDRDESSKSEPPGLGTLATLLPDSFFDIIARLVPGGLVLLAWEPSLSLADQHYVAEIVTSGVIGATSAILVAFSLGFMIDVAGEVFVRDLIPRRFWNATDDDLWVRIRAADNTVRPIAIKIMAEAALCRNLTTVALAATVVPPPILFCKRMTWHVSAASAIIAGVCFVRMRKWVSAYLDYSGVPTTAALNERRRKATSHNHS